MKENIGWVWKIDWRRNLFEWERTWEQKLLCQLEKVRVNVEKDNTWVWKAGETKDFTVKCAYKILKEEIQEDAGDLYTGLWKLKAQPSTLFTS